MPRHDIRIEHIASLRQLAESNVLTEKALKKLTAILYYFEHDASMEEAAKAAGVTASALRRWLDVFDPESPESLEEKSRRPKTVRSSDISESVGLLIRTYRQAAPRIGKEEIAKKLLSEKGETVSPSSIGRFIERECLYFGDCPLHRRKRLHAMMKSSSTCQPTQPLSVTTVSIHQPSKSGWVHVKKWMQSGLFMALLLCMTLLGIMVTTVTRAHAATLGVPLLVNTEAFETIDRGDLLSDIELRFGDSGEAMTWDLLKNEFNFSDDVHMEGNLTGSGGLAIEANIRAKGNLTLNSDNDTNDTVFTFGNATLAQSLSFVHATQKFRFSTSLDITGTMSGYTLTVSSLRNCDTIDTDANGVLSCGTDSGAAGGISMTDGDARYVKKSGDTMTGSLSVRGTISGSILRASNMTVSGAVVYSSGNTLRQSAKGLSGQLLISQGTSAPKWASPVGGMMWYFDGTQALAVSKGPQITMPFGLTLSGITLSAKGAPTGAALIYDINRDGTTIFSTRPQINASSTIGGGNAVFSTTSLPVNSVITIDIDQVGSTFAGSGVTIMLKGTRNY